MALQANAYAFYRTGNVSGNKVTVPAQAVLSQLDPDLTWPTNVLTLLLTGRSLGYALEMLRQSGQQDDTHTIEIGLTPKLVAPKGLFLEEVFLEQHEACYLTRLLKQSRSEINVIWNQLLSRNGYSQEDFPRKPTRHPECIPALLKADERFRHLKAVVYPVAFSLNGNFIDLQVISILDPSIIQTVKAVSHSRCEVTLGTFYPALEKK